MAPKITLGDYAKKLRALAKEAPMAADSYVKTIAYAINHVLMIATPVYSGRARANWRFGLDVQHDVYRFPLPKHPSIGVYFDEVASTLASNDETISAYNGQGMLTLTNNAPYIGRLNQGWSKQAPPGYIEAAIANAREAVRPRKKGLSGLISEVPVLRVGGPGPIPSVAIQTPFRRARRAKR